MLRILRSAFLVGFLFLVSFSSLEFQLSAWASCDLNSILHQAFKPPQHSKWFNQNLMAHRFDHEIHFRFREIKALLPVQEGSVAHQNPEVLRILRDIQTNHLYVTDFKSQFQKYHGHPPSPEDYSEFYRKRVDDYTGAMTYFTNEFASANPSKAEEIKHVVEKQVKVVLSDYKKAQKIISGAIEQKTMLSGDDLKSIDQVCGRISGSLTELETSVSLKGLETVSFMLSSSPELVQKLDLQLAAIQKEVVLDPKAWDRISEAFPKVMKNTLVKYRDDLSVPEKLKLIRDWVLSKEIDVVRKIDGKTRWLEVKSTPFTMNSVGFSTAGLGPKSYLYQIREVKDVLRFLKMEHQVELEYFVTGGMTPELTQDLLVKDGIRVIDTK